MEIICVEKEKNKLVVDIIGGGHTICNIIKDELKDNPDVKIASYKIDHPLVGKPRMLIETNTKTTPEKALAAAIKSAKKKTDTLKKSISKNIK